MQPFLFFWLFLKYFDIFRVIVVRSRLSEYLHSQFCQLHKNRMANEEIIFLNFEKIRNLTVLVMFVSLWSAVYTRRFERRKKGRKKYVTTRVVSTWDILTRRDRFFSVEQIWQQKEKRGRKSDTSWNNNCILKKVWPIWFRKKFWFSFHVKGNCVRIETWITRES